MNEELFKQIINSPPGEIIPRNDWDDLTGITPLMMGNPLMIDKEPATIKKLKLSNPDDWDNEYKVEEI